MTFDRGAFALSVCLHNFQVCRPAYEYSQQEILEWILHAHTYAERKLKGWALDSAECEQFKEQLQTTLSKIGLGTNKIQKRGVQINDCSHQNWPEMHIYNLDAAKEGYSLGRRMEFFSQSSFEMLEKMYEGGEKLPSHLIHVTCTGYISPSAAQKLVAKKGKNETTTVTHVYHMGCYASLPAIRIAAAYYGTYLEPTDIVHTEFGSIHMNPSLHSVDQLVAQSLFADGFIKYSVGKFEKKRGATCLKLLTTHEELLENSSSKLTWDCHDWGFKMFISKNIPFLIQKTIYPYMERLFKKAGKSIDALKDAAFAIHPGGPKIIEHVGEALGLEEEKLEFSKQVLQECGNMSSATLPHIWDKLLKSSKVKEKTLIVSVSFGPGMTISGALFEKW